MSDTTIYWALYATAGVTIAEIYLYCLRKQIEKYARSTLFMGYVLLLMLWPTFALALVACWVAGFINGIKKAIKR